LNAPQKGATSIILDSDFQPLDIKVPWETFKCTASQSPIPKILTEYVPGEAKDLPGHRILALTQVV
jgi:hypothetical protein